jgi:hypothetical protein
MDTGSQIKSKNKIGESGSDRWITTGLNRNSSFTFFFEIDSKEPLTYSEIWV